jgi:ATP-dependent RNA helicase DeaD
MNKLKFDELSLSPEMQSAITDMGFTEASPIQAEAIPLIMAGRDLIGQAQTGTGKTGAFGIPLLEKIDTKEKFTAALVLCPTRELALQVSLELGKFAKHKRGLRVLPVYGGESMSKQISGLRAVPHVVVGTPGRIMDHMNRKTLVLDKIKMIVLDEADEMLNMGFRDDIETILADMPKERQTVFFSATMPKPIMDLTRKYQNDPAHVKVKSDHLTAAAIEQVYVEVREFEKIKAISNLIKFHDFKLALVFCNMKIKVDELVTALIESGVKAAGIHGDLKQNQRSDVLAAFRTGGLHVLVATDVAARGIDVNDVDAVFNYDMPLDPENYVHRVGRTGRAGKSGKSFSFVAGRNDLRRLDGIERFAKIQITQAKLPTAKEMANLDKMTLLKRLQATLEAGGLELFETLAEEFREQGLTLHQLTNALLKLQLPHYGKKEAPAPAFDTPRRDSSSSTGRRERSYGDSYGNTRDRSYGGKRESRGPSENIGHYREQSFGRTRAPREDRPMREPDENMVRLVIGVGRNDEVRPGDIVGAIAGECDIPGKSIGAIKLDDNSSFVDIDRNLADIVISKMAKVKIKGKPSRIRMA